MTDDDPDAPLTRREFEAALRSLHVMVMQTKLGVERIDAQVTALASTLLKTNAMAPAALEAQLPEAHKLARERSLKEEHVQTGRTHDKHGIASPAIDCASLISICKGRCCRLTVALSFQDLDDGLRWDYTRPYELRRRQSDGYCVYSDPETRNCNAYDKRPGPCRSFDCRSDKRIWLDFEKRIPAPMEETEPPFYTIRNPARR